MRASKRKRVSDHKNRILSKILSLYEEEDAEITKRDLLEMIGMNTLWKEVSYIPSMGAMLQGKFPDEWTLLIRTSETGEYHEHITIKQSTVKNGGYGMFAACKLHKGDIISIYMGYKVERTSNVTHYSMHYTDEECIDPQNGIYKGECLFLGCHLANDVNHQSYIRDKDGRKHTNAKFHGYELRAECEIRTGREIFVDYKLSDVI